MKYTELHMLPKKYRFWSVCWRDDVQIVPTAGLSEIFTLLFQSYFCHFDFFFNPVFYWRCCYPTRDDDEDLVIKMVSRAAFDLPLFHTTPLQHSRKSRGRAACALHALADVTAVHSGTVSALSTYHPLCLCLALGVFFSFSALPQNQRRTQKNWHSVWPYTSTFSTPFRNFVVWKADF